MQTLRLLARYDQIVVVDGHDKVNRCVCQYRHGERDVHALTGLRVSAQCTKTPKLKSEFCGEHGGADADSETEEKRELEEPVASRTRLRVDVARGVPPLEIEMHRSAEGCEKQYFLRKGHTVGILVITRPCGVIVHMQELVQAEGTHEVLQALYDLRHQRRVLPILGAWP